MWPASLWRSNRAKKGTIMGEVRVISAVERAKVKGGNELPKPRALVVVQWIGFVWIGTGVLRLLWIVVSAFAALFGEDWDKLGDRMVSKVFESVFLVIALSMFLIPLLAMCNGLKGSRYAVPVFCTMGAMIACGYTEMPSIISVMGFIPPVAIWLFPSIRKWFDSLV